MKQSAIQQEDYSSLFSDVIACKIDHVLRRVMVYYPMEYQ